MEKYRYEITEPERQREKRKDAIAVIIKKASITQRSLADKAGVNRGQFSAWLKGGPMSQESEGKVYGAIKALISEASERDGKNYQEEIKLELAILGLTSSVSETAPDGALLDTELIPVSPKDPTCIERSEDRRLLDTLDSGRVRVAIIGGPGLGKSSLILKAKHHLEKRGRKKIPLQVIKIDFADYLKEYPNYDQSLLWWFTNRCTKQLTASPTGIIVRTPDQIVEWATKNILSPAYYSKNPDVAVLIDGLDALLNNLIGDHQNEQKKKELSALLMALTNLFGSNDPAIEQLKLVLATDRNSLGYRYLPNQHRIFDGIESYVNSGNFSQVEIYKLYLSMLNLTNESFDDEHRNKADLAWKKFNGHPLLTRAYFNDIRNNDSSNRSLTIANAKLKVQLSRRSSPKLKDSGLTLSSDQTYSIPATDWIRENFSEFFPPSKTS